MIKLILKIRFSPGDILMATTALRDLHKAYPDEYVTDVRSPAPEIFENNPYITPLKDGEEDYSLMLQYEMIHDSGWNGLHFSDGFRKDLGLRLGLIEYLEDDASDEEKEHITEYLSQGTLGNSTSVNFTRALLKREKIGKPVPAMGIRPELHLSDDEKNWVNHVEVEFGYKGKFWVINAGWKDDFPLKRYPYWQEVVDLLKNDIQIVQVGHDHHNHPALKGVLNLVGKTDLRQLIRLYWHAQGGLGVVSLPMVIMAAYQKPYVCVAGGREGVRWHIYPNHRFLSVNGCLPCCAWDGCWKGKTRDCANMAGGEPKCMGLISPEEVACAVLKYYKGGILNYGQKSIKQSN